MFDPSKFNPFRNPFFQGKKNNKKKSGLNGKKDKRRSPMKCTKRRKVPLRLRMRAQQQKFLFNDHHFQCHSRQTKTKEEYTTSHGRNTADVDSNTDDGIVAMPDPTSLTQTRNLREEGTMIEHGRDTSKAKTEEELRKEIEHWKMQTKQLKEKEWRMKASVQTLKDSNRQSEQNLREELARKHTDILNQRKKMEEGMKARIVRETTLSISKGARERTDAQLTYQREKHESEKAQLQKQLEETKRELRREKAELRKQLEETQRQLNQERLMRKKKTQILNKKSEGERGIDQDGKDTSKAKTEEELRKEIEHWKMQTKQLKEKEWRMKASVQTLKDSNRQSEQNLREELARKHTDILNQRKKMEEGMKARIVRETTLSISKGARERMDAQLTYQREKHESEKAQLQKQLEETQRLLTFMNHSAQRREEEKRLREVQDRGKTKEEDKRKEEKKARLERELVYTQSKLRSLQTTQGELESCKWGQEGHICIFCLGPKPVLCIPNHPRLKSCQDCSYGYFGIEV